MCVECCVKVGDLVVYCKVFEVFIGDGVFGGCFFLFLGVGFCGFLGGWGVWLVGWMGLVECWMGGG